MKKHKRKKRIIAPMNDFRSGATLKQSPTDLRKVRLTIRADKHMISLEMSILKFTEILSGLRVDASKISESMICKASADQYIADQLKLASRTYHADE